VKENIRERRDGDKERGQEKEKKKKRMKILEIHTTH